VAALKGLRAGSIGRDDEEPGAFAQISRGGSLDDLSRLGAGNQSLQVGILAGGGANMCPFGGPFGAALFLAELPLPAQLLSAAFFQSNLAP
jgi:hypothetical protein